MTNIIEETSKVAILAVKALNAVPVLLALVLLQFFVLGGVIYVNIHREDNMHLRTMRIIERCVVPGRSGDDNQAELTPLPQPRPEDAP